MLTHVVLFKLKDRSAASVATTQARLESLAGIETLRGYEVGANIIHSARSYDIALIARFDDLAGYEIYRDHPIHQPVLAHTREASESIIAVDYED